MKRDIRFNRYAVPSIATGLLLAVGGTACGSESITTSRATESPTYQGDPNASGSNPLGWREVIIADTQLQEPVTDAAIVVGFEEPGSDFWHESKPMPLDPTESGEVLLRIGPGDVKFRVQIQSKKGSKISSVAPMVKYEGPEPYNEAARNHPEFRVPLGWESN